MESTAGYKYVRSFVERYDGDGIDDMPGLIQPVKYWEYWYEADLREGWNPPNYPPHEFDGDVNDYVRLRAVAYAATKAADPTATVVGPATAQTAGYPSEYVGSVHWFMWSWTAFVAAGGLNTLDVVSFTHYFSQDNWDLPGYDEPAFILARVNSGRGGKPVWITETGWLGNPTDSYQEKSRSLVESVVLFWSTPWVGRYFWYDFQEQSLVASNYHRGLMQTKTGSGSSGFEPDPLFQPAFRAAELMQIILGSFTASDHPAVVDVGDSARAYHFSGHGLDVWVA
jgi:Glycosyl hydrolase catalytic core